MSAVKKLVMTVATVASSMAFGTSVGAQCVTVDPVIVPAVRVDPLDATGAAQIMQPVTMTFRRAGDEGRLRVRDPRVRDLQVARVAPALVMVGHWGLSFEVTAPGQAPFKVLFVDRASG